MHRLLQQLVAGLALTGDLSEDVPLLLTHHRCPKTAEHSAQVAAEARRLALRYDLDPAPAEQAGWLHDVSAVFPSPTRAEVARALGLALLPEEEAFPPISHQRLSTVVARELFGVVDDRVLSAIGCHTTLKAGASALDKVVFLADKIAWDQPGEPPYLPALLAALDASLAAASLVYLSHLWERRATLRVVHPWLVEAYQELAGAPADSPTTRANIPGGENPSCP